MSVKFFLCHRIYGYFKSFQVTINDEAETIKFKKWEYWNVQKMIYLEKATFLLNGIASQNELRNCEEKVRELPLNSTKFVEQNHRTNLD